MNKKLGGSIIGGILIVGLYFFSQAYIEFSKNATEDLRYLLTAIVTGSIAVALHLGKDYSRIKNNESSQLMINSFELLLLVVTPIFSIFQIFLKDYPNEMLILLAGVTMGWWFVVLYKTNKDSGKHAFVTSAQIYGGLVTVIALVSWILAVVN